MQQTEWCLVNIGPHDNQSEFTRERELVIETYIDLLQWAPAVQKLIDWANHRQSRTVCVCNVHSVVTARSDPALRDAINSSDMATPDGMPLAWLLGFRRNTSQARVSGMELTLSLCAAAESNGIAVSFYGSQPTTLEKLRLSLLEKFPNLSIGIMISPPFRPLTEAEQAEHVKALNDSRAGFVFVGLGCPKQEIWMHANRDRISAVQVGVGAVFDFLAGTVKRPPEWMQNAGLEWLGRLIAEPRRLWRRYLVTNTLFLLWLAQDLALGGWITHRRSRG